MKRALALIVLLAAGQPLAQPGSKVSEVRFHHLHYAVDDPGDALGEMAGQLQGTRTILQGLGVGVRVGREYVLLDRESHAVRAPTSRRTAVTAYADAVRWLRSRGLDVQQTGLPPAIASASLPYARLDHVAFAVDDPRTLLPRLKDKPESITEEAVRFRIGGGAIVEIVRDTDRPDVFWCPMHPDVRSPVEGSCPVCRMALVPIPPPRIGEYRLDVAMTPRSGGGISGLRFVVRDPQSGGAVGQLLAVHERPFHLFIVSRDLATFAHVHPETRNGGFEVAYGLDPGEYVLLADFLPAGGTSQLVHRAIVTPGYSGPLFGPAPDLPLLGPEQIAGGLRIRLDAARPRPRRSATLRFEISDAQSGRAVFDLQPYLGASGHLLIVSQDLTTAIHGHPEGVPTSGPIVTFDPVFPSPGRYKMWVQVQRKGEVVTAPFVIEVPSESR